MTKDVMPKLLDFGIAKILNPEFAGDTIAPTLTGMRLMTPEYASPEQIRGETLTPASDIYSLGVLLYEILAGKRPYRFSSRAPHDIERVVCEEQPENPVTVITDENIQSVNNSEKNETTIETLSRNRRTTPETLVKELSKRICKKPFHRRLLRKIPAVTLLKLLLPTRFRAIKRMRSNGSKQRKPPKITVLILSMLIRVWTISGKKRNLRN